MWVVIVLVALNMKNIDFNKYIGSTKHENINFYRYINSIWIIETSRYIIKYLYEYIDMYSNNETKIMKT